MKNYSKTVLGVGLGIALFILLTTGTVLAADSAKPGDLLYPADLFSESVQRSFIFSDTDKAEFEMKILDERKAELEKLQLNDSEQVSNAIKNLGEQEARVEEKLRVMNENSDVDEGEKERIAERSEEQIREHDEDLDQVQEQLRERDMDQEADEVEGVQEKYQTRSSGNDDPSVPNNSGNGNQGN
ncbi:hypothetical protein JW978_03435 [Candidatus Dojkabacteria bacterium]|nr:hypothetical protein [Candidatus Dojkabacteria bacterium]